MRWLLLFAGCMGPPLVIQGFNMWGEQWIKDEREVRQRASFELSCAIDQLQVVPLVTIKMDSDHDYAKQIGVNGCGHRLVYVRGDYSSGWLLNSSDGAPK